MAEGMVFTRPFHAHADNFVFRYISTQETVSLRKGFQLICDGGGVPSTWEVTLKLSKSLPFNNFRIVSTLKRTDYGENPLDAFLHITLANVEGNTCPEKYSMDRVFRGQEKDVKLFHVSEHIRCLFRNQNLPFDTLVIQIKVVVREYLGQHDDFGREGAGVKLNGKVIGERDSSQFSRL